MNFRSLAVLSSFLLVVACAPPNQPAPCRVDTDCSPGLVCAYSYCLMSTGADAGVVRDAGSVVVADDAGTTLSPVDAGPGCVPSTEICNGADDDCDGEIDEQVSLSGAGYDGGFAAADGSCVVGIGACQRTGTVACVHGQFVCSVPAGSAVVELCNGVDDDCDGQVDEPGAELCPAAGQTCGAGACSCPSGQAVCGSACVTVGSSCSVGVGACARTGSNLCVSDALSCSATAGTPSTELCNAIDDDCDGQVDEAGAGLCPAQGQLCTSGACACPQGQSVCNGVCKVLTAEVCDGLDNDCNGQIDEGVTIACLTDSDGDGFANSSSVSQVCAAASGACPSGYVAPSAGLDCAPSDATTWRLVLARVDNDNDQSCVGADLQRCVGASLGAGYRLTTDCRPQVDCNDGDQLTYQFLRVRVDADRDGYCTDAASELVCSGASPDATHRDWQTCAANPDCNDASRDEWQSLPVRADADADGWCAPTTISQCTNGAPKPGYRLLSQCGGTDCRDSNPYATSICSTQSTTTHIKACGAGIPASQNIDYSWDCGAGFHGVSAATPVETGADVSTVSFFGQFLGGSQRGTQTLTAVCRPGLTIGEETISLTVSCAAN